ncbi:hypothetical protein TEA_011527 [Camellia sinensis var. sinensis]|uniref:Hyaluronan/mRNA-binding protein domain-containing protein n=1 Tax=Camellia sinensis var. sinensis TaxID=542762 RepID=A0A4S4EZT7_CAMSN|nr:hypothetical protein TEA_011527 [Camellia sinensis var. sinensis]
MLIRMIHGRGGRGRVREMTLEEYEKVLEEKRKALLALKTEERKVAVDKELASTQQLSSKTDNNDIFVKLGSDKDKRKEWLKMKRNPKSLKTSSVSAPHNKDVLYIGVYSSRAHIESLNWTFASINEFLKPAGDRYYNSGTRGRGGRGRDSRGGYGGGGDSRGGYGGVGAK